MKFEPISARETSLEHYSKRVIGWHGIHILYYRLQEVVDDDRKSKKEYIKHYLMLVDKIWCVLSHLIVALRQISVYLPFIK